MELQGRHAGDGFRLATWRPLLEDTELQRGEPYLAATAPRQEVWLASAAAKALGVEAGHPVTVTSERGSVTAPLVITEVADATVVVTGDAHRVLCGHEGAGGVQVQVVGGQR